MYGFNMVKKSERRLGTTEIAGILRREISQGILIAKERLPSERSLADTYGVARGTVRQALNLLARESLVEIRRSSGAYVTFNDVEIRNPVIENARPLELIDTRFALEPHICRLAVLHASQQDLDQAEELLAKMDASTTDPNAFSIADNAFHTLLVETTGNRLLIWIVSQINSVRNQEQWSRMRLLTLNASTISQYNVQHRHILNAIRAREPERAAVHMKQHLETARLSLTRGAST